MIRIWHKLDEVIIKIEARIPKIPGHDLYSARGLGSTRYHTPSKHNKEGNGGLHCTTRCLIKWPNIMIEAGNPELHPNSTSTRTGG